MTVTSFDKFRKGRQETQAAFKVLAMIDPGYGRRRIAFLSDMSSGAAGAGKMESASLPDSIADVEFVYACRRNGKKQAGQASSFAPAQEKSGKNRKEKHSLGKIVPDVLVPGDVVMVKDTGDLGKKNIVEALRKMPGRRYAGGMGKGDDLNAV